MYNGKYKPIPGEVLTKDLVAERINKGADICSMIKKIYHEDEPWSGCAKVIAAQYTKLKQAARKQYQNMTEDQMLDILIKYDYFDIKDVLGDQ